MDLRSEQARREFRWPISASATIDTSRDQVWSAISAAGSLTAGHPFCRDNPVSRWPGSGSVDEVRYLNGVAYERRFRGWHEGVGFDIELFHKGKELAWAIWRIADLDDGRSKLSITVYPLRLQRVPAPLRWVPQLFVVRPRLRSYLESVVMGYKWFIEKGEAVPRNQFGEHPWFSAP
jgi:hypothetical protein